MMQLIAPSPPGRPLDQAARAIAASINENNLAAFSVTVINKPGNLGLDALSGMQNASDQELRLLPLPERAFAAWLFKPDTAWRALRPVALMAQEYLLLWVKKSCPANTLEEWLAGAERSESPVKVGGDGSGSLDQWLFAVLGR